MHIKTLSGLCMLVLVSMPAFGQTKKEFEVASVRAVTDLQNQDQVTAGVRIDGSQVHITSFSLKDDVGIAHQLSVTQVVGPDWMGTQRFNISATLPDGAKQADVPEMLRNLLSERFGMKAHREKKDFPVYALEVAATGLKIKESAPAEAFAGLESQPINVAGGGSAAGVSIDYGNGSTFALGTTTVETHRLTMRLFANLLTRFLDREVVDMTNLTGGYDLTLELTPEDRTMMLVRSAVTAGVVLPPQALALLNRPTSGSLEEALRKVGLTLTARKAPLDVIVVDDIQKTPTEN